MKELHIYKSKHLEEKQRAESLAISLQEQKKVIERKMRTETHCRESLKQKRDIEKERKGERKREREREEKAPPTIVFYLNI